MRLIMAVLVMLCGVTLPTDAQKTVKPTTQKAPQKLQKMVFTPQWTAQAQFAGYYVAKEKGFYRQAGLDVDIVHPSLTQSAMSRIRRNESHATTLQLAQAMEIIDHGIPLVNILQTSMNNALVIVSRRNMNPIKQKGARVGTWSAGFGQMAECMSKREHLNYQWIPVATNINLFISGAVDATLAMSYNEYYQIVQTGMLLSKESVYRFCDHGYNIQEDGVYMTRDYYNKNRDQARRFAIASRKGWEWAAAHPDETLEIVMRYVNKYHISTNRPIQKLMLDEILRLQVDRESKKREFRLRPDMVQRASKMMVANGMLSREITYQELINK
ncbi:MAG: ABC transporter substrate-binding protein [Bacteroidaceae bacterium]|nr:ABC transporter substrate-binding protein [Bacteroidaceae bacterium]